MWGKKKVINPSEAIEKLTCFQPKDLKASRPVMRFKGRLQVGADADITIFNPNTVIDNATFEKGLAFSGGVESCFE